MGWSDIYRRLGHDRNDFEAYAALESRVLPIVKSTLRHNDRQLAEDVIADTCTAVVMGLDKARGPDTFRGFVIGIYLNTRRFYLGQQTANTSLESIDLPEAVPVGPEHDELALLERCVSELPPRERRALLLRFFRDAPYRAIAEALKVTENNARQIVHAAKTRLSACARRLWPKGRR